MSRGDRAQVKLVPLALAVPGWQGSLIPEAVEKVARGVALEQQRLRGSRFLVVLRREWKHSWFKSVPDEHDDQQEGEDASI